MDQIFDPDKSFKIDFNTSAMNFEDLDEDFNGLDNFENSIIEQLRQTQFDIPASDGQIFEDYNVKIHENDTNQYEFTQPQSSNQYLHEFSESNAVNYSNEGGKENFVDLFKENFQFWNYMEPETWNTSNLTRIKKNNSKIQQHINKNDSESS
jgi:hypothetical protein